MLSRLNRLSNRDFALYRKGEIYKTHLFSIKIINNKNNLNKLGIIISKKNLKNRTERNSLKRKLCYYYNNSDIKNKSKILIITYISKEIKVSYNRIKAELEEVFKNTQ